MYISKNKITSSARSIAYSDIQDRRATMEVPVGPKGVMHDYVPFYFCKNLQCYMLLLVIKLLSKVIQFTLNFHLLLADENAVFTSSSANSKAQPIFYSNVQDLKLLDWDSIRTFKWGSQHDVFGELPIRKKKMAEGLILGQVGLDSALRITTWDRSKENKILDWFKDAQIDPPDTISNYPYNKYYYYNTEGNVSSFMGPKTLYDEYESVIFSLTTPDEEYLCDFDDFCELRDRLNDDFLAQNVQKGVLGLKVEMKCTLQLWIIIRLRSQRH